MPSLLRHASPHLANAPSLELDNVSVWYGQTQALSSVSLRLNRGDRAAIVGPNGAGKSTLFNVISGVVRPDSGAVRVYGSGPSGHICVGYVPQRNRIDWNFPATVADVVMMGRVGKIGLLRWPGRNDRHHVQTALASVDLLDLTGRQIGELSGGQQQRVFLARALAQEAEILLLDEPFTGLDAPSQRVLLEILTSLHQQGITILVATHDLSQAADQFPLVALLNRRLVAFGAPGEVLTTDNLATAYGGSIHILPTAQGAMVLSDTCCAGGIPPAEAVLGRPVDGAVALPAIDMAVDGERKKGPL